MTAFRKITSSPLLASLLSQQLRAQSDLWDQVSLRKTVPGTPHRGMSDIWARYNDIEPYRARGDFTGINDPHIPVFYPGWHALPALQDITFELMALVDGEMLGGVLITRIPPGGKIDRHIDRGWHVEYYDKFYFAVESTPGAKFFCETDGGIECLNPEPGDVHLFDNRLPHWVANDSQQDRITAIICIRTAKYGRE